MGSNDFFTVAYKILSYLKYCYEHGEQPDPGVINERTLLISKAQYVETLRMLSDHNYIEGVTFTHRSSPKCWCKLNSANLSFHKLKHTGFF